MSGDYYFIDTENTTVLSYGRRNGDDMPVSAIVRIDAEVLKVFWIKRIGSIVVLRARPTSKLSKPSVVPRLDRIHWAHLRISAQSYHVARRLKECREGRGRQSAGRFIRILLAHPATVSWKSHLPDPKAVVRRRPSAFAGADQVHRPTRKSDFAIRWAIFHSLPARFAAL